MYYTITNRTKKTNTMSSTLAKMQQRWKAIGELQNEGIVCKGNPLFKNMVDTRVRLRKLSKSETEDFFNIAKTFNCPNAPIKGEKPRTFSRNELNCRKLF